MSDLSSKPGSLSRLGTYTLSEESESDDDDTPTVSKPAQTGAVEMHDIAVAEASPAETKTSPSQMPDPEPTSTAVEQEKPEQDELFNIESGSNVQAVDEGPKEVTMPQETGDESSDVKPTSNGPAVDANENSEVPQISENIDSNLQELFNPQGSQSLEDFEMPKNNEDLEIPVQNLQDLDFQNFQPQAQPDAEGVIAPQQPEGPVGSPERLRTPGRSNSPMSNLDNLQFSQSPQTYQSPENAIPRFDFDETSQDFDFMNKMPETYQSPENPITPRAIDNFEGTSQNFNLESPGTYQSPANPISRTETPDETSQGFSNPSPMEISQFNGDVGKEWLEKHPEVSLRPSDFASPEVFQNKMDDAQNLEIPEDTSQNLDIAMSPETAQFEEPSENFDSFMPAAPDNLDPDAALKFDSPESTSQDLDIPQSSEVAAESTEGTNDAPKGTEGDAERMEVEEGVSMNVEDQKSPDAEPAAEAIQEAIPEAIPETAPVDLDKPKTPEADQAVEEPMEVEESVPADPEQPTTLEVPQDSDDVPAEEKMETAASPDVGRIKTPESYHSPETIEAEKPESPEMKDKVEDAPKSAEEKPEKMETSEVQKDPSREKSESPSKPQSPQKIEPSEAQEESAAPEESEKPVPEEPASEKPEEKVEEEEPELKLSKTPETYQSPKKSPTPEKPASPKEIAMDEEPTTSGISTKSAEPASPEKVKSPESSKEESPSPPVVEAIKDEEKAETSTASEKKSLPIKKRKISSDSDSSGSDDEPMEVEESNNGKSKSTPLNYPWKSPRQEPIDGIVQPRTEPPKGKPTRHTNCLDHLLFTVMKEALKHKHSWPFQDPVDALNLNIPEYHKTITRPMDLRTIERRLRNSYYWSYEDAVKDIKQMFDNCYKFNPPEYDVYKMAKTLESQMMSQLAQLPTDLNTLFDNCKRFNDRNDDIYIMCENIEGVVQRGLEYMPAKEVQTDFPEHQRRLTFPRANGPGKAPKTPKTRGRKSARGRKKVSLPRSASAMNESVDDPYDADEKEDEDEVEEIVEKAVPVPEVLETPKPTLPGKKRKMENGEVGTPAKIPPVAPIEPATPTPPTPTVATPATPAPSASAPPPPTPLKNPNSLIDWKSLTPRWQGKPAEWQKFCTRLLNEIHSVKNKSFAQIFYVPVDPVKLKIADYLDVIKNPMDLQTMKKKLDHKQYAEPEEFVHDMNLMIDNCCLYNPKGSTVYQNALDLKSLFEQRWKLFPRPGVDPIVSDSYINQNLVVNTDLIEDERINSYLAAVRAEEKQCAEKLEQLRNMSEGLYKIATERREAKLAGNTAPVLGATQINQLEKLGISTKNTPVMIPELISPALSVRSSSRAPVPKIIDDIGPSPTKARKISKPRASIASNVVPATPAPNPRGRKPKKSGRPAKKATLYSPADKVPKIAAGQPQKDDCRQYTSPYGTGEVSKKDFLSTGERLNKGNFPNELLTGLLRLMQIGQRIKKVPVQTFNALCQEEICFTQLPEELYREFVDYIEMMDRDDAKNLALMRSRLEAQAAMYGFTPFDGTPGFVPKEALEQADKLNKPYSPSPSASNAGAHSSDSDSGSESEPETSDSEAEPEKEKTPVIPPVRKVIEISAGSSRASTPQSTSAPTARPSQKGSVSPTDKSYQKRTLSESSSSSSESSSDSSDSDSETKPQVKKHEQQGKAHFKRNESQAKKADHHKKTAAGRPPPPKKKPQLTILDDLIPETPASKKPMQPSVPSMSRPVARAPSYDQKAPIKTEQEKHAEALRLRAEARRRREQEEEYNHQAEVMAEFEYNNY